MANGRRSEPATTRLPELSVSATVPDAAGSVMTLETAPTSLTISVSLPAPAPASNTSEIHIFMQLFEHRENTNIAIKYKHKKQCLKSIMLR